jgi:hypothetical protein
MLNNRMPKEILKLYSVGMPAILNDDSQARLSGFGATHFLQSGQHPGRNTIIGDTLLPKSEAIFCPRQSPRALIKAFTSSRP